MKDNATSLLQPAFVSINQWRSTVSKACIGAYVERGVAEDIAEACVSLLSLQIEPSGELIRLLKAFQREGVARRWQQDPHGWSVENAIVLKDGPSIIDMLQASRFVQCSIDSPLVLIGLAKARVGRAEGNIDCRIDDNDWRSLNECAAGCETRGQGRVELRLEVSERAASYGFARPPVPDSVNWQELQLLAAETLVPADDSNRSDAGAGDTDND